MPDLSDQNPSWYSWGASGCGKSTVASLLAGQLGWDFQEGDDLHSDENVEKMASGQPLTDKDRWPWLNAVALMESEHYSPASPESSRAQHSRAATETGSADPTRCSSTSLDPVMKSEIGCRQG